MAVLARQCSTYYLFSNSWAPISDGDSRGWWNIYYEQSEADKALKRTKIIVEHIANFYNRANYWHGLLSLHYNFNSGGFVYAGAGDKNVGDWVTVNTTTHYVYHNSEGVGSFSFQGKIYYDGIERYTNWESIPLPTIPQQSTVTATNANIGSASSININRANSSYKHKLYYKFTGQADYTLMAENIDVSHGWTIPTSAYSLIPNNKEISCTIKCETYNGATLVGSATTTTMKAFVDENANRPEITDLNGSTGLLNPLTGNQLAIIKYISSFSVYGDLSSKNSAKLKSISVVSGDGKSVLVDLTSEDTDEISLSYYTTQLLLQNLESNTFTITLTDSRNISKVYNLPSVEIPTTLVDYVKLTLNPTFYRTSPINNEIAVIFDGNYFNDSFGAVNNTLEVKYRYRELGEETWSEYYNLTAISYARKYTNGNNPIVLEQVFDYTKQYYFEILAIDKIYDGIGALPVVSRGIPVFWWNENTFNVEKDLIVQGTSYLQTAYSGENKILDESDIVQTLTTDTDKVPSAKAVKKMGGTILWTNPNPSNASGFTSQTVTLSDDISNYDMISVVFRGYYGSSYRMTTGPVPAGNCILTSVANINSRRLLTGISGTSVTFGDATDYATYGSAGVTNNVNVIPEYIIGYKMGLF